MVASTKAKRLFDVAGDKDWLYLLQDVQCKDIIINSLAFIVEKERIRVFGFVIMNNHMHIS